MTLAVPINRQTGLVRAEACEKCKFATAIRGVDGVLECRRNPPQATIVPGASGRPNDLTVFPKVQLSQWCGEFRQKLEGLNS